MKNILKKYDIMMTQYNIFIRISRLKI